VPYEASAGEERAAVHYRPYMVCGGGGEGYQIACDPRLALPAPCQIWKTRSTTFTLPNGWLEEWGVSREVKRRVLRDLEAAGLITVERPNRKSPKVTIVVL
jgi:hypothetical protein